ncbi:hypothetical protein RSOLAG1IB_07803 [Rhizoctonia solani AG-1 IB]|uniref:Uncharacterized protein n=1 Tax=Thanatephorus cucumeris (strain AG1-IB / isolate 7/3/14) TaxID=1108050 RepID=A0A0B7FJR7_THACB|nr:hypothetical protein RSOLAG1IB_07803 [Rhizoctonia solani AG-1 IB]
MAAALHHRRAGRSKTLGWKVGKYSHMMPRPRSRALWLLIAKFVVGDGEFLSYDLKPITRNNVAPVLQ